MKHWHITGPKTINASEVPVPNPDEGEVRVRMSYTALSPGSNLHVWLNGAYGSGATSGKTDALYMGSGVIESVGPGVDADRVGERVAFNGLGHQEYGVLPSAKAHRVPDGVSLRDASLAYLNAWSVSALHLGRYAAAETVAVVGLGLVGASAAITADAMGARVLGLDVIPERLELAHRLGIGCVLDASAIDNPGSDFAYMGDDGADLIIETSGHWSGFRMALSLARDYSRIALMGIYRDPPPADVARFLHQEMFGFPSKMHYQRLQIIGCGSDPESIHEPMPRMATRDRNFAWVLEQAGRERLNLGALVTSVLPADEIESALVSLESGDRSQLGVVFDWQKSGTDVV